MDRIQVDMHQHSCCYGQDILDKNIHYRGHDIQSKRHHKCGYSFHKNLDMGNRFFQFCDHNIRLCSLQYSDLLVYYLSILSFHNWYIENPMDQYKFHRNHYRIYRFYQHCFHSIPLDMDEHKKFLISKIQLDKSNKYQDRHKFHKINHNRDTYHQQGIRIFQLDMEQHNHNYEDRILIHKKHNKRHHYKFYKMGHILYSYRWCYLDNIHRNNLHNIRPLSMNLIYKKYNYISDLDKHILYNHGDKGHKFG